MRLLKVAAGVVNQTPLDWDGNRDRIVTTIREAREQDVGLLCLPELAITGYGCEDAFLSPAMQRMAWRVLQEVAVETEGLAVAVGLPVMVRNQLYNAVSLMVDGEIRGFVAKQFLAGHGLHYEPRWFKPWPAGSVGEVRHDGRSYPVGDFVFECGDVRIGFEICEDAWVATRPGGRLARRGVDVVLNPSASHFAFGKEPIRERLVLEGSRSFGVSYVYTNLLGNEAGRAIYGGGALIASGGRMLAKGPRLTLAESSVTAAVVDVDLTRMQQARLASAEPEMARYEVGCVQCAVDLARADPELASIEVEEWEASEHLREEEFTRAMTLALFDYLRKSRSRGFVVSLSGGADSTAVACLVSLMVRQGLRELGPEPFFHRLGREVPEDVNPSEVVRSLLCCVYQATRNSSDATREAAAVVAKALGADYHVMDVDRLVEGYVELAEEAVGRKLNWDDDDVALQNIQARVRGPSVWMLANLKNALLLATSNRSEAAVGYATMDGDTCGGLSPIAGIDKAFLRRWLKWLEQKGAVGVGAHARALGGQRPGAHRRASPRIGSRRTKTT